jgi:hypothetical protein
MSCVQMTAKTIIHVRVCKLEPMEHGAMTIIHSQDPQKIRELHLHGFFMYLKPLQGFGHPRTTQFSLNA